MQNLYCAGPFTTFSAHKNLLTNRKNFPPFRSRIFSSKLERKQPKNSLCGPGVIILPKARGVVEDTRLETKDTKKLRTKAKDRPFRGQGLRR